MSDWLSLYSECTGKHKVLLESMGFYVMDEKGLHKVSVVSPFSFTIILEAQSREIRSGNSDKLFYADDLILVNQSLKGLKGRVGAWKGSQKGWD